MFLNISPSSNANGTDQGETKSSIEGKIRIVAHMHIFEDIKCVILEQPISIVVGEASRARLDHRPGADLAVLAWIMTRGLQSPGRLNCHKASRKRHQITQVM